MKRTIFFIQICISLILFLSSCSRNINQTEGKQSTIISSTSYQDATNEKIVNPTGMEVSNRPEEVAKDREKEVVTADMSQIDSTEGSIKINQESVADKDFSEIGFKLWDKELLFILKGSKTDTDIINLFGNPQGKTDAVVWEADGYEHQTWNYLKDGFEIDFIKNDDNIQIANSASLTTPCNLTTSRNIGIGSSKEDVNNAYKNEINPEGNSEDPNYIVAGTEYGGVIFEFENDKVSRIFIGAAAE